MEIVTVCAHDIEEELERLIAEEGYHEDDLDIVKVQKLNGEFEADTTVEVDVTINK